MEKASRSRSILLIIGITAYWTWTLTERSGLIEIGGFSSGSDTTFNSFLVLLTVIAVMLVARFLGKPRAWLCFRVIIALLAVLGSLVALISQNFINSALLTSISPIIFSVLRPGLNIVWTAWLISHSKGNLIRILIISAFCMSTTFLLLLSIPLAIRTVLFYFIISIAGVLTISISVLRSSSEGENDIKPSFNAKDLAMFITIRFALGASTWFAALIANAYSSHTLSDNQRNAALIVSSIIVFLLMLLAIRKKVGDPPAVLVVPFMIPLLLIIPLLIQPSMLVQAIVVFCCFASMIASATHLFANIGLRNMSNTMLMVIAQLIAAIGSFTIDYTIQLMKEIPIFSFASGSNSTVALYVIACLLLLLGIFYLAKIVFTEKTPIEKNIQTDEAVSKLSIVFKLTPREEEVLALLAKGYSRPYISEKLVISISTVKTHINSIYLKAGINKHDKLLDAIRDMEASAEAQD